MDIRVLEPSVERFQDYLSLLESNDDTWLKTIDAEYRAIHAQDGSFGVMLYEGDRPRALCLAGFLTPDFSRQILTTDRRWVNAQALEWSQAGRPFLLPDVDRDPLPVAAEAGRDGLHLHFFIFDWKGPIRGAESMPVRLYLGQEVQSRYLGVRLRALTIEAHHSYIEEAVRGGFRVVRPYAGVEAALLIADVDSADVANNTWMMATFCGRRPRLLLSHRQRRILFYFRNGYSDEEIADRVFLSPKSMKTNWDRIFAAFAEIPSVVEARSKRRAILEFLRTHPEECWPHGN